MIQTLRKRLNRKDEGFTLIELMVVVLIIAILLAIAIPTFLGARGRAQNRAAQSSLRNALTAEKTVYTDSQVYSSTVATMSSVEPSLAWANAAPGTWASNSMVVNTADTGNELCLTAKSASGTYYGIIDIAQTDSTFTTAGTYYLKPSGVLNSTAGCTAAAADVASPAAQTPSGAGW